MALPTSPAVFAPPKQSTTCTPTAGAATTATSTAPPLADTAVSVLPAPAAQEGPPWNMRIEEVRSAKGELRYYRLILAVPFAALITSHTGMMHTMQTRNAAAALVLACPPSGIHFRFLLHHVDVLRSALHRTTEFAVRTVQRFFHLLFSPTQRPKGTQQQVLKGVTARLEAHAEACDTYVAVKAELANALNLRLPLPPLAPATSGWVVPVLTQFSFASPRTRAVLKASRAAASTRETLKGGGGDGDVGRHTCSCAAAPRGASATRSLSSVPPVPSPSLSDILYDATSFVCEYSEGFASAFVCGLLSFADDGGSRRWLRTHSGSLTAVVPPTPMSSSAAAAGGVEDAGTSRFAPRTAATSSREASVTFPSLRGVDAVAAHTATPDCLAAYASYFDDVALQHARDSLHSKAEDDGVEGGGWVRLSKPVNEPVVFGFGQHPTTEGDSEGNDNDACLRTHVSVSTPSSVTTELSPLTVDADVQSPPARRPPCRTEPAPAPNTTASPSHHVRTASHNSSRSADVVADASTAAAPSPPTALRCTIPFEASNTHPATIVAPGVAEEIAYSPGLPRPATSTVAPAVLFSKAATATPTEAAALPLPAASPLHPPHPTRPAVAGEKEDEYALHCGRLGRVVIFTVDAALARRLLLLAAFLWSDCCSGGGEGGGGGRDRGAASATPCGGFGAAGGGDCEAAQRMYETAIAAAVDTAEYANTPIQWVPEEFCEARLSDLCSRFSPENALLVVAPRQLQCRRVCLRKHVAGTTVLIEQQAGKEARIRSAAFPFRCSVTKQTVLLPDPTVTTLLREARSLHQGSDGTVDFAGVFQRMARWLRWHSAAAVLKKREARMHAAALQATLATAADTTEHRRAGSEGGALSRYASMDQLWLSRSTAAMGSWTTTPTSVIPVASSKSFARALAPSSITSISSCSPVMHFARSWNAESSAEDSLLPGSRGGASSAWACRDAATAARICSTSGGGRSTRDAAADSVNDGSGGDVPASSPTTSTLLVSHGLLQPPSAFVMASPTAATAPRKSSLLRFTSWFKPSPTAAEGLHPHPILSPTTLGELSACNGGQLPQLLCEDDDLEHIG